MQNRPVCMANENTRNVKIPSVKSINCRFQLITFIPGRFLPYQGDDYSIERNHRGEGLEVHDKTNLCLAIVHSYESFSCFIFWDVPCCSEPHMTTNISFKKHQEYILHATGIVIIPEG